MGWAGTGGLLENMGGFRAAVCALTRSCAAWLCRRRSPPRREHAPRPAGSVGGGLHRPRRGWTGLGRAGTVGWKHVWSVEVSRRQYSFCLYGSQRTSGRASLSLAALRSRFQTADAATQKKNPLSAMSLPPRVLFSRGASDVCSRDVVVKKQRSGADPRTPRGRRRAQGRRARVRVSVRSDGGAAAAPTGKDWPGWTGTSGWTRRSRRP